MVNVFTPEVIAELKKIKTDSDTLSDKELEQLKPLIDAEVAAQTADITKDLIAIRDAVLDPATTAAETTAAIGTVLDVTPVNADAPAAS